MTINTDNYEIFFINYFDGQLSATEIDALMLFLNQHPELEDSFHACRPATFEDMPAQSFKNKNTLKKNVSDKEAVTENNIDEFLIASLEHDLTPEAEKRLALFLKENPAFEKDLTLFHSTISAPDYSITFSGKAALKKPVVKVFRLKPFYYTVAAAAAVLLLFVNIFMNGIDTGTREAMRLAGKDFVLEARTFNPLFSTNDTSNSATTVTHTESKNTYSNSHKRRCDTFAPVQATQIASASLPVRNTSPVFIEGQRDEYSSIYNYVKISESQQGVEDYEDILPEKPRESFLLYAYNKLFNNADRSDTSEAGNPTLWQLVDVGTYGINTLAKTDFIEVTRSSSENSVKTDFAMGGRVVYSRSSSNEK